MYQNPYERAPIPSIRLDKDVVPLSQFRANVALFVQQVRETGRPMLITQRGRGIVVLLDVREYEAMRGRIQSADGAI
jgi:antitoxin YefM